MPTLNLLSSLQLRNQKIFLLEFLNLLFSGSFPSIFKNLILLDKLTAIYKYIKGLDFIEKPNYDFIIHSFRELLEEQPYKQRKFDW